MRRGVALLAAGVLLASLPGLALAAAPANDLPAGAIVIGSLPASINQDTTEATVSTDDVGCGSGGLDQATVWYKFTPAADVNLAIDATASSYDVGVNLFEGVADAAHLINCFGGPGATQLTGGTTYYIMFADADGDTTNGGTLMADLSVAPPPIEVTLTVDSTGKVDKAGVVTLTGTISCTRDADFSDIQVSLRQPIGRFTIHGSGFNETTCGPSGSTWWIQVSGDNGKFGSGKATADVFAEACDQFSCSDTSVSKSVRLRK
jgi:hypothetical protein